MKFAGTLLLFGGYVLIYAAVARGGVFATEPWMGLLADAYSYTPGPAAGAGSTSPAPAAPSPTRPRTSPVTVPTVGGIGHRNIP